MMSKEFLCDEEGKLLKYDGNDAEVIIPDGITVIGDMAFQGYDLLTSVTIPDTVRIIDVFSFEDCTSLANITIQSSVETIDHSAFLGCTSLESIMVDENNANYKSIDGNLYTKDGKTLIRYAVGKKDASFVIPDGVTVIGAWAFSDCASLTSVTIPKSAKNIDHYAFVACTSLASIAISEGVEDMDGSAFIACTSLEHITVDESNTNYKSIDGNLYTKDGKTLIRYAAGKKDASFVVPDGVTVIGDLAFDGCTSLASVTIPDSVTSIGDYAFYDCASLKDVKIPDSVTKIGEHAFRLSPYASSED